MKRIIRILLIALLCSVSIAQAQQPNDYIEDLLKRLTALFERGVEEKLYIQCDKPYYSAGESIWFKGHLRNAVTHAPFEITNFIYAELVDNTNTLVSRVKVKRDSTGFNGYIALDPKLTPGNYTLRGYSRWMMNEGDDGIFSKAVSIISPIPETNSEDSEDKSQNRQQRRNAATQMEKNQKKILDYTVQFFPEGGALLPSLVQKIALKAVAEDGFSIEVKGEVFDSKDNYVCDLASEYKGMGLFSLYTVPGESYYAMVTTPGDKERRFDLPVIETQGATLSTTYLGDKLYFQANATDTDLLAGSHVVIHSRGRLISAGRGDSVGGVGMVERSALFDGISVISLVNADNKVLSERLVFKRPEKSPLVTFSTNELNYSKRELAEVTMQILDSKGNPATQGEFGVAVTDNSSIEFDPAENNILSYLLLTSDLKGYIEDPALYFDGEPAVMDQRLDLLMRTQGWRRFDLSQILVGEFPKRTFRYENEVSVNGHVKGYFGNDARRPNIMVLCPAQKYFDSFELDESSRFRLVGLDIPDSTTYVIQSRGRRGANSLVIEVSPEIFPEPKSTIFKKERLEIYVPVAFVNQSKDKFFYEGGMNVIDIDAVSVTGTASTDEDGIDPFATQGTGREELESMFAMTLTDIIETYPNMSISEEEGVSYRNGSAARFIVDGVDMEWSEISNLQANTIETINFYSGAMAAEYSDSAGGVFVITMAEGFSAFKTLPGIAYVSPLGYQRSLRFYQPDYKNPTLKATLPPDYRTTIFWSGELQPDANGYITFELFTADKVTSYTITIEGVTESGEIVRATSNIERTKR